jgi:hypothetical protein
MGDWVATRPAAHPALEETAERIEICIARKRLALRGQ